MLRQSRSLSLRSLRPNFSRFRKIEQPPGFIVGTVNEPYKAPEPDFYEGSFHWTYERALSMALVPLTVAPFVVGVEYPLVDTAFSLAVLVHSHIGLKSCIIDYIPERVYGAWHGVATKLLTLGTGVGVYGIYLIETTSNGVFTLLRDVWFS